MPLAAAKEFHFTNPAANTGVALTINGFSRTSELADRSLAIHVATQGNSLGTADGRLNDPAVTPAPEDIVFIFQGTQQLFDGVIRSVEVDEWKIGTHKFASWSAQDRGPTGALASAAPFGLSDTPNGTTTFGYKSLKKFQRTTEGGTVKTSYEAVYQGYGLWANQIVPVTSSILGLAAVNFTIVDAQVRWLNKTTPTFTFELGESLVRLSELVKAPNLSPGAITGTQISDGAISTPKLAASAVIAGVVSIGDAPKQVLITAGSITVINSGGQVIIDGSSDMFRILATGTVSNTGPALTLNNTAAVTLTGLGVFAVTPAQTSFINLTGTSSQTIGIESLVNFDFVAATSGGAVTKQVIAADYQGWQYVYLNGSFQAVVELRVDNATAAAHAFTSRYYVLAQASI